MERDVTHGMQYSCIGAVGECHQLGRPCVGVAAAGVYCHVRRRAVGVVDRLDQSPTGRRVQLEQRRLRGRVRRKVRQKVFAAVMPIAV